MAAESSLEQEALKRREKLKALREKSALAAQVRFFYYYTLLYCVSWPHVIYIYSKFKGCKKVRVHLRIETHLILI